MVSIKEVPCQKLIEVLAEELKKEKIIEYPEWARYVKTGSFKERPPEQENWWYLRAASTLRRIALDGPVGVQRLRTYYGGRKNLGHQPSHFKRAGGKIIRNILQQLEEAGLIEQKKEGRKGRILTPTGQKFIDKVIKKVIKQ
ncbi:MAG: 30S ribosomal protein S19e [Candidatus Aenigmarchaeota archaeon]|nr:30S ribosomal protein S19e [Candidatus Aenigmarchaeota archaeon]